MNRDSKFRDDDSDYYSKSYNRDNQDRYKRYNREDTDDIDNHFNNRLQD